MHITVPLMRASLQSLLVGATNKAASPMGKATPHPCQTPHWQPERMQLQSVLHQSQEAENAEGPILISGDELLPACCQRIHGCAACLQRRVQAVWARRDP